MKRHASVPVRASIARMRPGTFFIDGGRVPTSSAGPMTTTFSKTSGGELDPIAAVHEIDRHAELRLEIDDAVVAEGRDRQARLRVERDEVEAGRHGEDALVFLPSAGRPDQ